MTQSDSTDVPIPPRYWWLKRLTLAAGCLVVGVVLLRLGWGWEANRQLAAEIARYRAAGQPVYAAEIDKQFDAVPDEDNAALLYEQASAAFVATSSSGRSIADFYFGGRQRFEHDRAAAAQLFKANAAVLQLVHEARSKPRVVWRQNPAAILLGWAPVQKEERQDFLYLLGFAAKYELVTGDHAAAIETAQDSLALCHAIESYRSAFSADLAHMWFGETFDVIEEMAASLQIGHDKGSPDSVRPATADRVRSFIQALLDEEATRRSARRCCYAERMDNLASLVPGTPPHGLQRLTAFLRGPVSVLETVDSCHVWTEASQVVADGLWPDFERRVPEEKARGFVHAQSPARGMARELTQRQMARLVIDRYFTYLARRRMAATALAILLFEADHGQRPATLAELVPDYLPAVPIDPFSAEGATIQYQPRDENPVLYSIGRDGRDNDGTKGVTSFGTIDFANSDIPFSLAGNERWRKARPRQPSSQAAGDHEDEQHDQRKPDDQ